MVKTWGRGDGGVETCEGCGARYKVTIFRAPARDKGDFHCGKCGHLIREWNSTQWPSFEMIEESPPSSDRDG
jgi:predicted Zn finger-like uncharacterized protein